MFKDRLIELWNRHLARRIGVSIEPIPSVQSRVVIHRYTVSVMQALELGRTSAITAHNYPDTCIRPQRCTSNAPCPGFVTINEIRVANLAPTIGGIHDAYDFSPNGVEQSLDMPTITPAMRISVLGTYTGRVPQGFEIRRREDLDFLFTMSFKGPASADYNVL